MNKPFGYIYKTTNLVNGKVYVGQHKRAVFDPCYYGSGKIIRHAIAKYGIDNFKCEVLQWCFSLDELNLAERLAVALFKAKHGNRCYNIADGGNGYAMKFADEESKRATSKRKSIAGKKRFDNPVERKIVSDRAYARWHDPVQGAKWRASAKQRYERHPEHRAMQSARNVAMWQDDNYRSDMSAKLTVCMTTYYADAEHKRIHDEAMRKPSARRKRSEHAKRRWQFLRQYGTTSVYRYRYATAQFQPWMSFIIQPNDNVVVFQWDTRKVLFQCNVADLPTGYVATPDSRQLLVL